MRFVPVLVVTTLLTLVDSSMAQEAKTPRRDLNGDPLPDGAIARLGTVRFHAPSHGEAIALSPVGTMVAGAWYRGEKLGTRIEFMDTATGQRLRFFDLADGGFERIQFTPDGKSLVVIGWSIAFIDVASGKSAKIEIPVSRYSGVALSPDGQWLAAQHNKYVYDAPVGLYDLKTGKEAVTLPGRGASCKGMAFSPDGKRLLLNSGIPSSVTKDSMSYGNEAALACIDIESRKIIGETKVAVTQHVALCQDGETVAFETADQSRVRIVHLPTGAVRTVIPVKKAKFVFAPDGKSLLTVDESGACVLWDSAKGSKIRDLEGTLANTDFRILGISNDNKTIAISDGGWHSAPLVIVWNGATGKRAGRPPGHDAAITCIAYAPAGKLLVSGSLDRTVRLWNAVTGEHLRALAVHKEAISAVAISSDGKLLASSSIYGVTRVSTMADGATVAEFTGPANGAKALAFSGDGKKLFAGGGAPEVLGWEVSSAKEIMRLKTGHDGVVMAFGDGGTFAVTANGELRAENTPERLQVWTPSRKLPIINIPISPAKQDFGSVRCDAAIFSKDGRVLASSQISEYQGIRPSYGAAQLRLWERASGQPIATLAPAVTEVLAFSPDGRYLASGGAGISGHLRVGYGAGIDVWDTVTGKKAGELPVTPQCVAFSADGLHIATGGRDHCVTIWEAPRINPPKHVKAPSKALRDAWWSGLGSDALDAYKVIGQMLDAPDHAVTFLKERVKPVQRGDADIVAKLIKQLSSETYAERVKAQAALGDMGEGAAHLIKQALDGNVSLELRRRLEDLLSKCDETSALALRHHRVVAVLEWIATPKARELVKSFAAGAPRARLTVDAESALQRMPR